MMQYDFEDDEFMVEKRRWEKVRKRNLIINIAKQMILQEMPIDKQFTRQEIKDIFSFKEGDILVIAPRIFDINDNIFIISSKCTEYISKIIQANKAVRNCLIEAEADFIRLYGEFLYETGREGYISYAGDNYQKLFNRLKEIIPIIHWGRLPIFDKYLIYNRGKNPEKEMLEFYEHPDCLNALLNEVKNNGIVLSNESDKSLDKEMSFSVYTRRWGHIDNYTIKRTANGWYCEYMAINGDCRKNGEGGLLMNLEHDSIFYPKNGVKYALEKLWEDADEGRIDFEELEKRMQQIADWISAVEKSINAQPEWVGYY